MLFLLFDAAHAMYAMETTSIIEVVPMVHFQNHPKPNAKVAGIMLYRGTQVVVFDLCSIFADRPCRKLFSTRIMIVRVPSPSKDSLLMGLMAENMTETVNRPPIVGKEGTEKYIKIHHRSEAGIDGEKMVRVFDLGELMKKRIEADFFHGLR